MDLQVQGGFYEQSSVDDFNIRGYNGQSFSEWQRVSVRTEPEYIEGLLSYNLTNPFLVGFSFGWTGTAFVQFRRSLS